MNNLLIGTADKTERFLELAQDTKFLLIDDGPIADAFSEAFSEAELFDITEDSFNPLRGIDYVRKCDFISALLQVFPGGENTLTKEGVPDVFFEAFEKKPKLLTDLFQESVNEPSYISAQRMVRRLLRSPVLRQVLCNSTNFSFKGSVIVKLDRAEIGDFDAFVLASLLIGQHKGHIIIPDFGFYGRDYHTSLIRQNRLIAGVQFLSELSKPLQQAVLSIKDKTVYRTTSEDAERLKFYVGRPNASQITDLSDGDSLVSQ